VPVYAAIVVLKAVFGPQRSNVRSPLSGAVQPCQTERASLATLCASRVSRVASRPRSFPVNVLSARDVDAVRDVVVRGRRCERRSGHPLR
jgi:hypothetical protein